MPVIHLTKSADGRRNQERTAEKAPVEPRTLAGLGGRMYHLVWPFGYPSIDATTGRWSEAMRESGERCAHTLPSAPEGCTRT